MTESGHESQAGSNIAPKRSSNVFRLIGPGILIAATGVGAGDLATGALVGNKIGVAILWAVSLGAFLKFVLNEGLSRWQLATNTTLLEGVISRWGMPVKYFFLTYLVIWSYLVGCALMGASGIAMHAMLPIESAETDKIIYGILHSLLAVVMVRIGGYKLFDRFMRFFIFLMFATVIGVTIATRPDWSSIAAGLTVPQIPNFSVDRLYSTIGLLGGIGGTLTILCYGYWIREEGWQGRQYLKRSRIDLTVGYAMTALFGFCMVVLGSQIVLPPKRRGATLLVNLSDNLAESLGEWGTIARWAFLFGAWGAIFSSLLGGWQCIPHLFADVWQQTKQSKPHLVVDSTSRPYRWYLYGLSVVPIAGLFGSFAKQQLLYAFVSAFSIPLIAIALLMLNGQTKHVGKSFVNSKLTNVVLGITILFFVFSGAWIVVVRWNG